MFGYVKPHFQQLSQENLSLYRAAYCGLCKTQRKKTGLFSCFTLSYDFVFLYLFRAELTKTESTVLKRKIRIVHPKEHCFLKENDQLIYCACCAALLNYHKLRDGIKDEPFFKALFLRPLLPLFRYFLYKAEKQCPLPSKQIKEILEHQTALECRGVHSPDTLAECSGALLAAIASFGIDDELSSFAAERFGMLIGKWIYLVDAIDDYEEDLKKHRFTPFAKEPPRKEDLAHALDALCNDADLLLAKIPVYNSAYRSILENVLYDGMHEEAMKALRLESCPEGKDDTNE